MQQLPLNIAPNRKCTSESSFNKNLPGYNSLTPKIRNYTIKPKVINLF